MQPCIKCGSSEFYKNGKYRRCKPCTLKSSAAWQKENPDKSRLKSLKWSRNNSASCRTRCKNWRQKNPTYASAWYAANTEKIRATNSAWRAANPDKVKRNRARQYAANPERAKAYVEKWKKLNPEKVREIGRIATNNRRVRKLTNGGKLSKGLAEKLFKLQRGLCACGCGQSLENGFHLDHIMPLVLGGINEDRNIQLLTAKCNSKKRAKHPVDFMQSRGFLI